ncbi:hypothetical protein [Shewanella putrefaciens]|uniref:hypothetical protein n=1 Tax=Shewanella putrefaciens TaxID=24 RepID=UPI002863246F|nr:hypothetical protein [Shewanella putrefaciens]MDR6965081.1 type 1 fimbria pilin [Shewanella putrefaciens]
MVSFTLLRIKKTFGVLVLIGMSSFVYAKNEGVIRFQGAVVEPSCELHLQGISCYEVGSANYNHTAIQFKSDSFSLAVGGSKSLPVLPSKFALVEVVKLRHDELLVSANHL